MKPRARGRRGFFYELWESGGDTWTRIAIPAAQCPRIAPEFLEEERRRAFRTHLPIGGRNGAVFHHGRLAYGDLAYRD